MRKYLLPAILALAAACSPSPAANDLVIHEYRLAYGPSVATDSLVFKFASGDQGKILAETAKYRDYASQAYEYNRSILARFGYTLERHECEDLAGSNPCYSVSGGWQEAHDLLFIKPISVNASGTNFIGLAMALDGTYVLTKDLVILKLHRDPAQRAPYLYVGDRLLSMETGDMLDGRQKVSVYLDDAPAFEADILPAIAPYGLTDGPWSWDDHWALALLDGKQDAQGGIEPVNRLIVDGADLNALKGYEQSYGFAVLGGRPFYFYQREGKIGISFAGHEFARNYEEIPHYECCSGSLENPGYSMNMAWFFARRGEDWYYVEAYVPENRP
jgi:hypothetical protein